MLAPCSASPVQTARAGRARDERRCLVHAGEGRVVLGAQAEAEHRGAWLPGAGPPHRRDVTRVVHQLKLRVRGGRRGPDRHPGLGEQAEGPGQLDRQLDPDRRERMAGPEVVRGQPLVPRDVQRAGHALILPVLILPRRRAVRPFALPHFLITSASPAIWGQGPAYPGRSAPDVSGENWQAGTWRQAAERKA
jgi:hypothetical protein